MNLGKYLMPMLAVSLAVGIGIGFHIVLHPYGAIALLAVVCLLIVAFTMLKRGWAACVALTACFIALGIIRAQLPDWSLIPQGWQQWALDTANGLSARIHHFPLRQDVASFLDATLLGQRTRLPEATVTLYRQAGAAHILALSGLHQGILFYVVNLLLLRLVNHPIRYALGALEIAFMWGYALVAGLPISLIRATLMMTLFVIAQIRNVGNNSLHTLGVSAFILLLFQPTMLTDVGFQLSFTAVGGIILLYPLLSELWHPRATIVSYMWKAWTLSLAAQLGTWPLILHYFHHYSLSGLFLSPLYILLITGILYAALSLFLLPIHALQVMVCVLVEYMTDALQTIMSLAIRLPMEQIHVAEWSWAAVALSYMSLACMLPVLRVCIRIPTDTGIQPLVRAFQNWPLWLASLLCLAMALRSSSFVGM